MKYSLVLGFMLLAVWLLWSGHFDKPFVIALGVVSCAFCLVVALRMQIVDEEGAPKQLGIRPFTHYAPWLTWEIIQSNIEVTRIIVSPEMPLQRNMVTVTAHSESALGRVILANSITLTPGTVSIRMEGDQILVHALSFEGSAEELSGEMDRRICQMENRA